jgi:alpha-beta hydrolase superfamily lysophospholipase
MINEEPDGFKTGGKMRRFILIFQLICFVVVQLPGMMLLAQTSDEARSKSTLDGECQIVKNLFYKSGSALSGYEKKRCFLDLYLPADRENFPVIVWFHGGSLQHGSKDDGFTQDLGKRFANSGVAVAVANYRLYPQAKFPSYLVDSAACVDWVIDHIQEYGGNSSAVFIAGHSAGGYLAYMLGMDQRYLESVGVKSEEIAGIIPVSGQTFTHYTVRKELGVPNPRITPLIDEASPCFHARKDAPAVLAICTHNDPQDRIEENQYMIALLKKVDHPDAEYLEIKDRTHMTLITEIPNPGDPLAEAALSFISGHSPSD